MIKWAKTPKGYVALSLIAYLLIASIGYQDIKGIKNGIIAIAASLATDVLFGLFQKRKRIRPDGALITGLIIALILSSTTSWLVVAATSIIAILSKHLLVHKKKPIFNPATFGLLLSIIIFKTGQNWWGAFADLPVWMMAFLLIGGYAVTNRVNKFPQVFSFLGTYLFLLLIMGLLNGGDASDALRPPFIQAALFFAFMMLTDPPTSPAKYKDQIAFGVLTALVGAAIYALFGGLMYLFIGLLVGNCYHYLKIKSVEHSVSKRVRNTSASGSFDTK
ncbi:RnfABCDGE type electron transport complex subunit D [Paenibacillus sp. KN14-4R]|uniref:RnfABCDGE type electron transport complex subunit D n=1 Tax=Paenibacillus sp. KN14-4R TaxID=3445773 RepID=UPI003FA0BA38